MTQHTDQRAEKLVLRTTLAMPPPKTERTEPALFQTLDELSARHGNPAGAKDRLYLWGGGVLIGAAVLGVLYMMIVFLE